MKQAVPIDDLLAWAIGRMKADAVMGRQFRPGPQGVSGSAGLCEVIALGARVQKSGFAETVLGAGNLAASPAMQDAMMAYAFCFEVAERWLAVEDGRVEVWTAGRAAAIGWGLAPCAGGAWMEPLPGSASYGKASGVALQDAAVRGELITRARAMAAPEWHEGYRRPAPVLCREPKRRKDGALAAQSDFEKHQQVMFDRAIYAAWHAALCELASALGPHLVAHVALAPAASPAPWEEGNAGRGLKRASSA